MRSPSAATALDGAGHVNGVAGISRAIFSFEPHYNIAPSQSVPVIIQGERGFEAKLMKWGLVPSWSNVSMTCAIALRLTYYFSKANPWRT
jgi:putative SOS response-associated peptidase YedK